MFVRVLVMKFENGNMCIEEQSCPGNPQCQSDQYVKKIDIFFCEDPQRTISQLSEMLRSLFQRIFF